MISVLYLRCFVLIQVCEFCDYRISAEVVSLRTGGLLFDFSVEDWYPNRVCITNLHGYLYITFRNAPQ